MKNAGELEALVHRLEVSGADRTRWPAPERLRFAQLIAQDEQARRLVEEAGALDRLLNLAPNVGSDRVDGLVDRIVAAAEQEGATSSNVEPFRRRTAPPSARVPMRYRTSWQAAALLAASLFVGAFVGTSGLLQSSVGSLGQAIYSDSDSDSLDVSDLSLDGSRSTLYAEEVL